MRFIEVSANKFQVTKSSLVTLSVSRISRTCWVCIILSTALSKPVLRLTGFIHKELFHLWSNTYNLD